MSKDGKQQRGGWSQQKRDALRRALQEGRTPPGYAQLSGQLQDATAPDETRQGDEEELMLAHLISAALEGVDIPRQYPQWFQRLVADPALRAAFLDALDILDEAPSLTLPLPPSRDLSFLDRLNRVAPLEQTDASGPWQVRWRRSAEEIAGLFSFLSQSPLPALREAAGFLEDETVTLLRGKVSARGMELDVTLEATRPAEQPDELRLSLWVLAASEHTALPAEESALVATVTWGSYEAHVTITGDGHFALPPRAIAHVVDEANRSAGDLTVTIQPDH